MRAALDETHDPLLRSWVDSANTGEHDFPIQNLPFGVFRRRGSDEPWRGGIAIGDAVLDLSAAVAQRVFHGTAADAAALGARSTLNALMAAGPIASSALRTATSRLLRTGADARAAVQACLIDAASIEHALPARIGDYTDFFTSEPHMLNAGRVFRPDAPPLPQFKWLPIAYHGRTSTLQPSGVPVRRPHGQQCLPGAAEPSFGPTRQLDYELELGWFVGTGNEAGRPVAASDAERHLFGVCLLNDWSARDLQSWEALPLGPFLAKNFATSLSPWLVTVDALAPFRCALPRAAGDPAPLPHLAAPGLPGVDLQLEAWLIPAGGRCAPLRLTRSRSSEAYWGPAQLVAHHTSNGCRLRPGDLLGSGTLSGPAPGEEACLLERTHGGRTPLTLEDGSQLGYLRDGDTVALRAWAERPGHPRVGLGECRAMVVSASV